MGQYLKKPDCACFRDAKRAESLRARVAIETTNQFINSNADYGVCSKAMYHVAIVTIVSMLSEIAHASFPEEKDKANDLFFEYVKKLGEDVTTFRNELDAEIAAEKRGIN